MAAFAMRVKKIIRPLGAFSLAFAAKAYYMLCMDAARNIDWSKPMYQDLIHELAPEMNPAGVEASMRLEYGVLDHLPHETFAKEVKLAAQCERVQPGFLRQIADSMGMGSEYSAWETTLTGSA